MQPPSPQPDYNSYLYNLKRHVNRLGDKSTLNSIKEVSKNIEKQVKQRTDLFKNYNNFQENAQENAQKTRERMREAGEDAKQKAMLGVNRALSTFTPSYANINLAQNDNIINPHEAQKKVLEEFNSGTKSASEDDFVPREEYDKLNEKLLIMGEKLKGISESFRNIKERRDQTSNHTPMMLSLLGGLGIGGIGMYGLNSYLNKEKDVVEDDVKNELEDEEEVIKSAGISRLLKRVLTGAKAKDVAKDTIGAGIGIGLGYGLTEYEKGHFINDTPFYQNEESKALATLLNLGSAGLIGKSYRKHPVPSMGALAALLGPKQILSVGIDQAITANKNQENLIASNLSANEYLKDQIKANERLTESTIASNRIAEELANVEKETSLINREAAKETFNVVKEQAEGQGLLNTNLQNINKYIPWVLGLGGVVLGIYGANSLANHLSKGKEINNKSDGRLSLEIPKEKISDKFYNGFARELLFKDKEEEEREREAANKKVAFITPTGIDSNKDHKFNRYVKPISTNEIKRNRGLLKGKEFDNYVNLTNEAGEEVQYNFADKPWFNNPLINTPSLKMKAFNMANPNAGEISSDVQSAIMGTGAKKNPWINFGFDIIKRLAARHGVFNTPMAYIPQLYQDPSRSFDPRSTAAHQAFIRHKAMA